MVSETKMADIRWYLRTFAFMLNTGVALTRELLILEENAFDEELRSVIKDVRIYVESGATLSKSMAKHEHVFPTLLTALIRAGEVGGVLDETLARAADYADHEARTAIYSNNAGACKTFQLSLWVRQLSCLLQSGVPVLQTLDTVSEGPFSQELREATLFVRTAIREGKRLSDAMEEYHDSFPPLVRQTAAIGEETGRLDEVSLKLADHLEQLADEILRRGDKATPEEQAEQTAKPIQPPQTESHELAPIIALVDEILAEAIKVGASDIHLQPTRRTARLRFRVDGVLHPGPDVFQDLGSYWPVLNRLKAMTGLDIVERRFPQRGRLSHRIGDQDYDLRVSTYPTTRGEAVSIRIQGQPERPVTLHELGWEGEQEQQIEYLLRQPCGIIAVAGPNGSGRTTTLYAMLQHLNNVEVSVVTVEETLGREIPGVQQATVDRAIGNTPVAMLRHLARQDPDVLMVEEVRDRETFERIIQLALEGHLVLVGLACNDAAAAVEQLVRLSPEPPLLADSLIAIVGQRLVRKVCEACAENVPPDANLALSLEIDEAALSQAKVRHGRGCENCGGTGCKGRIAAFEVLTMKPGRLLSLIKKGTDATRIRSAALAEGFRSLQTAVLAKALRGVASPEEAMRLIAAADSEYTR